MSARWKKDKSPEGIIRLLGTMMESDGDKVTVKSFFLDQYWSALEPYLEFGRQVPKTEYASIIRNAVHDAVKGGSVTSEMILREIIRLEGKYLRRQKKDWMVCTSLTIEGKLPFKTISIWDSKIAFNSDRGLAEHQEEAQEILEGLPFREDDKPRIPVSVTSTGRGNREATARSVNALNALRGLWNFILRDSHFTQRTSGMPSPVGLVRIGPVHTSHDLAGKILKKQIAFMLINIQSKITNLF